MVRWHVEHCCDIAQVESAVIGSLLQAAGDHVTDKATARAVANALLTLLASAALHTAFRAEEPRLQALVTALQVRCRDAHPPFMRLPPRAMCTSDSRPFLDRSPFTTPRPTWSFTEHWSPTCRSRWPLEPKSSGHLAAWRPAVVDCKRPV